MSGAKAASPAADAARLAASAAVSQQMSRMPTRNSGPEMAVRRALHAVGLRYRLHRSDLPGTPDIVLPGRGLRCSSTAASGTDATCTVPFRRTIGRGGKPSSMPTAIVTREWTPRCAPWVGCRSMSGNTRIRQSPLPGCAVCGMSGLLADRVRRCDTLDSCRDPELRRSALIVAQSAGPPKQR